MQWYLLNIAILTIVWFLSPTLITKTNDFVNHREKDRKPLCIVGTVNWILLSGLRNLSVGADTYVYKMNFETVSETPWQELFDNFYMRFWYGADIKDPGYAILEKAFQFFCNDYQIWLFFIAILFMVPLGIQIYRHSSNPYLSFILYSTLFYAFFSITGHRQTIATALVVCFGISFILKKKLLPFLLLMVVACTIHMSAIVFLPFYWLWRIKINYKSIIVWWVATIIVFAFRNQFLSFIQNIIGYESYQQTELARGGVFMILLFAFALLASVFSDTILGAEPKPIMKMSFNGLMMACFFAPMLLINQSFMRVVQYFSLFLLFILPESAKVLKEKKSQVCYTLVCVVVMVFLLLGGKQDYSFFWQ